MPRKSSERGSSLIEKCLSRGKEFAFSKSMFGDSNELAIRVIWFHGAVVLIPVLILMAKTEWDELAEKVRHIRRTTRHWHIFQPVH